MYFNASIGKANDRQAAASAENVMISKTVERLLEEQNTLIREQNELLKRSNSAANGASSSAYLEELRERARRNTPWGCKPPAWAR